MIWPAITAQMDADEFVPDPPFPMGGVKEPEEPAEPEVPEVPEAPDGGDPDSSG